MRKYILLLVITIFQLSSSAQQRGAAEAVALWNELGQSIVDVFQEAKPAKEEGYKGSGMNLTFTPEYDKTTATIELEYTISNEVFNEQRAPEAVKLLKEDVLNNLKAAYTPMERITIKTVMQKADGHISVKLRTPVSGRFRTYTSEILPSELTN